MTVALERPGIPGQPNLDACEEVLNWLDRPRGLHPAHMETESDVRAQWEIDQEAYGDCNLSYEKFLEWWTAYPFGSHQLMRGSEILASIGLYPIEREMFFRFRSGEIPESELTPLEIGGIQSGETPAHCWYASGIVVVPKYRGRSVLRDLFRISIPAWASRGHAAFPLSIAGLAEYAIGARMLERCGFTKERSGEQTPDGCDLYTLELVDKKECADWLVSIR